jgi:hypothetical protein
MALSPFSYISMQNSVKDMNEKGKNEIFLEHFSIDQLQLGYRANEAAWRAHFN